MSHFSAFQILHLHVFEIPFEKIGTGGAEAGFFVIRIPDSAGRVHHTPAIPAMGKAQGMTEFMKGGLFNTFQE